jgi:hypothetical protein
MRKASGYIAIGLILFVIIGRSIEKKPGEYFLNAFWSDVVIGFLFALFIFNFYLGYIEKDIEKNKNK